MRYRATVIGHRPLDNWTEFITLDNNRETNLILADGKFYMLHDLLTDEQQDVIELENGARIKL